MQQVILGIVGGVVVFAANAVANRYIFGFNYRPIPVYLLWLPFDRMSSRALYLLNTVNGLLLVVVGLMLKPDPLIAAGFITFGILSVVGPFFLK